MASKTSTYYKQNPEAAKRRRKQQAEYNKKPGQSKYRAECNKGRSDLGLQKGNKKDASHTKSGKMVAESRSTNRARNGANGKSTKK